MHAAECFTASISYDSCENTPLLLLQSAIQQRIRRLLLWLLLAQLVVRDVLAAEGRDEFLRGTRVLNIQGVTNSQGRRSNSCCIPSKSTASRNRSATYMHVFASIRCLVRGAVSGACLTRYTCSTENKHFFSAELRSCVWFHSIRLVSSIDGNREILMKNDKSYHDAASNSDSSAKNHSRTMIASRSLMCDELNIELGLPTAKLCSMMV